ncbi:hypothetical protein [Streptomyces nojiriensis]|uniref:hypothetical protein n=1 Tax=Streptomyces nojiriensis TaxID=66374 RepID=UPI0035D8F63C
MSDGSYGPHDPAPYFDQQGQHVYGPQYNAEGIHFNQADPQAVADAIAWNRQRWVNEQDERRRRYYEDKSKADRRNVQAAVVLVAGSILLYFVTTLVIARMSR